jgi:hypothetical protein
MSAVEISNKALMDLNCVSEWLKFAFNVDRAEFTAAFAKIGLSVKTQEDLDGLAELHRTKGDVKGFIKNTKGKPIYFDVLKIVKNINITKDELQRALKNKVIQFVP